jgi:ATPase subunit of ABC transporter with duplicated ATPase domains
MDRGRGGPGRWRKRGKNTPPIFAARLAKKTLTLALRHTTTQNHSPSAPSTTGPARNVVVSAKKVKGSKVSQAALESLAAFEVRGISTACFFGCGRCGAPCPDASRSSPFCSRSWLAQGVGDTPVASGDRKLKPCRALSQNTPHTKQQAAQASSSSALDDSPFPDGGGGGKKKKVKPTKAKAKAKPAAALSPEEEAEEAAVRAAEEAAEAKAAAKRQADAEAKAAAAAKAAAEAAAAATPAPADEPAKEQEGEKAVEPVVPAADDDATVTTTPASSSDADEPHALSSSVSTPALAARKAGKASSAAAAAALQTVPSGIRMDGVSITFKNAQVLNGVSWDVKAGERVGLVGVNGAGKTTQLQIIAGALEPDEGAVLRQSASMKIAYLTQEFDVVPSRTVREEFMSAFADQMAVLDRTEAVQKALEGVGSDMEAMASLLDELADLTGAAADLDIRTLDKRVDEMMPALGFGPDDNDRLVASYSGGWQMRMCLGKILLQEPDLLLLDEPTNHLDLNAIEWLERYLKTEAGDVPMVIVSHDREFLDRLCTKIVETERGVATTYKGNYSAYVAAKAERTAAAWVAWERQQKEVARLRDLVTRLSGGAQSGRAAAAAKDLARLTGPDALPKPFTPRKRAFTFPAVDRMGQAVLTVKDLTHGYGGGPPLLSHANLEVVKGERLAIIGPNGAGKSTFLRLVMGTEQPDEGVVALGAHGIKANYFEQNQAEALSPNLTVLETVQRAAAAAGLTDMEVKALLGRMQFGGTAMDKRVAVLSGGEKARLALATFMASAGTLLVLDEPTNHLDIPSKEMLEDALRGFGGAVIAVSHDRYFLRRVATRVVAIEGGALVDYEGDYARFLERNAGEAETMAAKAAKDKADAQSRIKAKSKQSKAEKLLEKKAKAKAFAAGGGEKKAAKNAKRWK